MGELRKSDERGPSAEGVVWGNFKKKAALRSVASVRQPEGREPLKRSQAVSRERRRSSKKMEGEPDLQPAVLLMEQGETVAEIRNNKIDLDNCDHKKKSLIANILNN